MKKKILKIAAFSMAIFTGAMFFGSRKYVKKKIKAEELTAAFAGGGVVAGKNIKAAAVVQVIEHACGLGVLGVVAVYDKHYFFARLFAGGIVKALKRFTAVGAYGVAYMHLLPQPVGSAVTPHIVVVGVTLFVQKQGAEP